MARKFLAVILLLLVSPVFAEDLMDSSKLNMRRVDDMNMSGILPAHVKPSSGGFVLAEFGRVDEPSYDLSRMKQVNPNFETYPDALGIVWLKHAVISRSDSGGMEVTRLYVILGRRGLGGKWLNWNIPIPSGGSAEILEANVYDFTSLAGIGSVSPVEDSESGIIRLNFSGLPETFILAVSWKERLPSHLSVEGICWFQEDLRVWESVVEVHSPQKVVYKTFPDRVAPESEVLTGETVYRWRSINVDPFSSSGELARLQRAGVVFSTRWGFSGALAVTKDIEALGDIPPNPDAIEGFRRSKAQGVTQLIDWLKSQPEIELAEGFPRKLPNSGALTRAEKVLAAKSWLVSQKVNASLHWRLPFEPDDLPPLCAEMFTNPVLEIQGVKGISFHDIGDPKLLAGAKIFGITNESRLVSRRIPSSKPGVNRLSAVMDLQLNEHGSLSGTVRVILRGAWGALMLGNNPTDGTARGAILSLFPGLTNYKDVKYSSSKGTPEITFTLENKPGIGGTGRGVLAILPFFEPTAMRKLGGYEPPVEVAFPFIVDQNITLGFPKNASQALVSGKVAKNPDKINYSEAYTNRRHRLIAESRFEVNMPSVTSGNMSLLRRHLDQWRLFSARQIPVR